MDLSPARGLVEQFDPFIVPTRKLDMNRTHLWVRRSSRRRQLLGQSSSVIVQFTVHTRHPQRGPADRQAHCESMKRNYVDNIEPAVNSLM